MFDRPEGIGSSIVHACNRFSEGVSHALGGGGAVISVWGVIDANTLTTWAGVAVSVGAMVYGFVREQRKKDRDDVERRTLLRVMVAANVKAAESGTVMPYPELIEILVSTKGERGNGYPIEKPPA